MNAAKRAVDYYRTTYPLTTLTPRNGWSWSTYQQGVVALYRHTGDARYLSDAMAWGRSNNAWPCQLGSSGAGARPAGAIGLWTYVSGSATAPSTVVAFDNLSATGG